MFKILDEVCTPKRGTKYSAYVDLFAREDITIGAGETKIVKLGVKIDLDMLEKQYLQSLNKKIFNENISSSEYLRLIGLLEPFRKSHYLEVALRSSFGVKGLIISNGIGIIDLDYPDEIGLIVHNPYGIYEREYRTEGRLCGEVTTIETKKEPFEIKKGDKVAQCTLKEHKGYLMGYESDVVRTGGFGSTDKKEDIPMFDKPDFFKCNELN